MFRCVDLANEAVVIDSISFKIIVSFFKNSFKYMFVRSQSLYCPQKMLSLQRNNNNDNYLFRNLLAQRFMK